MKTKKKGFTIIELVIVIAVIGVLSAILIPTFSNLTAKAEEAVRQENMRNALVQFQADAMDGYLGDANDDDSGVALPSNVTEQDTQMSLDGVSYVYDSSSSSWVAGEFKAVSGYASINASARGRYNPRRNAVTLYTLDQLGPHDIPYDPDVYKLMYVGGNFRGFSTYNDCIISFLALISEYAEYINNAVETGTEYNLATVAQNENYSNYLYNKSVDSNRDDGFKIRNRDFLVGDDNAYEFKPKVVVIDEDGNPAAEAAWDKPFTVTVEKLVGETYVTADEALYSLPDTLTLDNLKIDFADEAVGETFRITTAPTGVSAKRISKFAQKVVVTVVDGYNVYRGLDLAYVDDTADGIKMSYSPHSGDAYGLTTYWETFKTAKGLDTSYHPSNFVFQTDVVLEASDFPSEFVYGPEADHPGTLINDVGVYRIHGANRDVVLEGNYFQLNCSVVPLIALGVGEASTSAFFQAGHYRDQIRCSLTFRNLNATGNAPYVTDDSGAQYAGGFCFAKSIYATEHITFDNVIARRFFTTAQSQYRISIAGGETSDIDNSTTCSSEATARYSEVRIYDSKFMDNFNVFIYNYGGHVRAERTLFKKCGGPVVIQDHVIYETWFTSDPTATYYTNVAVPNPWIPRTYFTDCVFDNYVVGTEPWFIQWHVDALVGQIKGLSAVSYYTNGLSFVLDSETHAASTAMDTSGVMNFVALNKAVALSGSAENVCGEVKIIHSEETEDFCYADEDKTYVTRSTLQTMNTSGAPVFQNKNHYAFYNNEYTLNISLTGDSEDPVDLTTPVTDESDWADDHGDYTGIYYNGMMMIMGVKEVPAA